MKIDTHMAHPFLYGPTDECLPLLPHIPTCHPHTHSHTGDMAPVVYEDESFVSLMLTDDSFHTPQML